MALYAVIMAGGVGSRFWPRSRQAAPKQFLDVLDSASLIQNTFARLQPLVEPDRVYVVTNERYVEQTQQHLPAVPADQILAEPVAKNTAPCIAYAAAVIHARDPEATMVVLPADHVIRNVARFHDVLRVAVEQAQDRDAHGVGPLVTIGIEPTHPETGYGYIQYDPGEGTRPPGGDGAADAETEAVPRAYPVRTFAEKPDLATAERFLDSGDFLWNSGMFIWRADAILAALREHLPAVADAFAAVEETAGADAEAVRHAYERTPKISIDYGVMERAKRVFVVPGSFGWSDVGDWRAVYDLAEKDHAGNATAGQAILHNTSRSYVRSDSRMVVLVGMRDTAVVDTGDAVLVCHLDQAQQVKNIVDYLGSHGLDDYI